MNRILLILIMCLVEVTASAQYANINIDYKTEKAMIEAFALEQQAESYYTEQVKKILEKYTEAEVATATVFSSKYLERKALTNLGVWTSSTENYYYKRIYNLVATKMMPKILNVAQLMMKNPENALYWGSYLLKICEETKALCQQFEAVVTNSRLGFNAVYFLEMRPEVKQLFEFAHHNIINWDNMQRMLTEAPSHFTKENLKADVQTLYRIASQIASETAENVMNRVMSGSNFNDLMQGKLTGIYDAVVSCEQIYGNVNSLLAGELKEIIGQSTNPAKLFKLSEYNMTNWLTDYIDRSNGQYYTQRWYIYRRHSGNETVATYFPPTDNNSILNGPQWYRVGTTDPNYYPTPEISNAALANSEKYAGWSRDKVNELNRQDSRYQYTISYYRSTYILNRNGKQYAKAFAYPITVRKSWDWTEEVDEEVFDSYKMDLATFQKQMQVRVKELSQNEEGILYFIGYDNKNYYSVSNAEKLKGTENVIISVTCHNNSKLTSGTTAYKCSHCKGYLTEHTKQCSMWTTLTEDDSATSELDALEKEYQQKLTLTQNRITMLERQNAELVKQIPNASVEEAAELRQQISANQEEISSLKAELTEYQNKIKEIQAAKDKVNQDSANQTDAHYRIPAIMNDCKTAYRLTWEGDGYWSGYTFIRKAHSSNMSGTMTFKASIKITRKPEYMLGIQIHRAIVQIDYELMAEFSSTNVVEMISLDKNMTDQQKEKLVNDKISAVAKEYPSCQVDTQYMKTEPTEEDTSEDQYHLLWSSDRLEIARGVDTRLHKIYADLISIEKMMNYKRSIIDVLLTLKPPINEEQGKRQTIIQQARKRWLNNAAKTHHSGKYNGKYEDKK